MALSDFKPMIGGVLKAGGLSKQHVYYDDYFQELWLILWHRLLETQELSYQHNHALFRFLLWRLKDLQRKEWQQQKRTTNLTSLDWASYEDEYPIFWQTVKANLSKELQPIYQHLLDYPEMSLQARSQHLKIHRKTLRRRLDAIGVLIK